jgi:CRP/FNR family cyclic AMP-dependent transcriptional regulator
MSELDRLSFFDAMDYTTRNVALARSRVVRASKGQALLAEGDRSTDVFIVVEGRVQSFLYLSNGREISLCDIGEDEIFGHVAAIDEDPRGASFVAMTDVRLATMSRIDFMAAIDASPGAARWLLRQLTGRIRRLNERVFELSTLNVSARLHCELLRLAAQSPTGLDIRPAPTHAELANRIGTHREAVTREIRALTAQNIVRAGRRRLEFLDLPRLQTRVGNLVMQVAEPGRAGETAGGVPGNHGFAAP